MEYRQLEAILCELHQVEPENMKRFQARIRILQDVGVPNVQRVGKGGRVDYTESDLWISHFGLVLDQGGMPPSVVARVSATATTMGFPQRLLRAARTDKAPEDVWLTVWFQHRGFSGESPETNAAVWVGPKERIVEVMELEDKKQRRAVSYSSVNIMQITRDIERLL